MFFGAPVRSLDDITRLRRTGFGFGEIADDLEPAMNEVPDLGLTLDVGHANLNGPNNKSIAIIKKFGKLIRHVHLHDNCGGHSQADYLHLPIGDGTVDFRAIMTSLMIAGYDGTMTLEVKPEFQEAGKIRIEALLKEIQKV
ncbi:MAG: sugar phosphate isomerase/epimerase family protein [Desulfomonilaceae bacterium]